MLFYLFTVITCAVPVTDSSATIDCSSLSGDPANYGETCSYTCKEGYVDTGGNGGTITCGDKDGTIVGEFDGPQCERKIIICIFVFLLIQQMIHIDISGSTYIYIYYALWWYQEMYDN